MFYLLYHILSPNSKIFCHFYRHHNLSRHYGKCRQIEMGKLKWVKKIIDMACIFTVQFTDLSWVYINYCTCRILQMCCSCMHRHAFHQHMIALIQLWFLWAIEQRQHCLINLCLDKKLLSHIHRSPSSAEVCCSSSDRLEVDDEGASNCLGRNDTYYNKLV